MMLALLLCSAVSTATVVFRQESDSPLFTYEEISNIHLEVQADSTNVSTLRGGNVVLPCRYTYEGPEGPSSIRDIVRIQWTKVLLPSWEEEGILAALGQHERVYNTYTGRARLRRQDKHDVSLELQDVTLEDDGLYKCEVIDGLEDKNVEVELTVKGVVYPYQSPSGRYNLTLKQAQEACDRQDSKLATPKQMHAAWASGFEWCNAGWLSDASVRYPVQASRGPCGGEGQEPGIRSYGYPDISTAMFDAFCFSSTFPGKIYYLSLNGKGLSFIQASEACFHDGAVIAKLSHLYAAWALEGYERCDAGWLADGSVRYAISVPRPNCGGDEPGIRTFGYPSPTNTTFGVYCYKST
uniref:Hyaluronan and proteoglycan link protein 3 n=1 Tax=Eptatretus burgeri TaxID=7764 RepID=A0A8C4NBI8_EPTBU